MGVTPEFNSSFYRKYFVMRPAPKGWCPSALKPMASGDGLIVRLRPKFGRITRKVLLSLLDLSENYGNGLLDFTNRANLQIRGVSEGQHTSLIEALYDMGLIDDIIEGSGGRNIILTPTWLEGGLTETLAKEFYASVNCLPTLPSKFGFSIDTEAECSLMKVSSDITFNISLICETSNKAAILGIRFFPNVLAEQIICE